MTLFSTFPVVRNVIFASHIFPLGLSTICSQATHTTRWSNVTHFSKVRKSRLAEYSIKQYCQTRECEMLPPVLLIINLYLFPFIRNDLRTRAWSHNFWKESSHSYVISLTIEEEKRKRYAPNDFTFNFTPAYFNINSNCTQQIIFCQHFRNTVSPINDLKSYPTKKEEIYWLQNHTIGSNF